MTSLAAPRRRGWSSRHERDLLRALVIMRDGIGCHYCRVPLRKNPRPTLDHIWPVAWGRIDAAWNLVLACGDCNSRRGTDTWCTCGRCRLAMKRGRLLLGVPRAVS